MPKSMIITIGDELLGGHVEDINSGWLAGELRSLGYPVAKIEIISDRLEEIIEAVRAAAARRDTDRIFVCGGMGPTPDDRTLEGVAGGLGVELESNPEAVRQVQMVSERLHEMGRLESKELGEAQLRMTRVPKGSQVMFNSVGAAPGIAIELDPDRWMFILPGVPPELRTVFSEQLRPRFFGNGHGLFVKEVPLEHIAESTLFAPMQIVEKEFPDVSVGSYPQREFHRVLLRATGHDEVRVNDALTRVLDLRQTKAEN